MTEDNVGGGFEKSKPLTYDPIKAVLKYSKMEKREQLARRIPTLKQINKSVPNRFTKARIGALELTVFTGSVNRAWNVIEKTEEKKETCKIYYATNGLYSGFWNQKEFELDVSCSVAHGKLLNEYLRKGTSIETLHIIDPLPEEMQNQNWNLKVRNLEMFTPNPEFFRSWLKAFDSELPPKTISFKVSSESLFMFEEPMVQTCRKIILQFPYDNNLKLDDWFFKLQNPQMELIYSNFPHESMEKILNNWVDHPRPLGTSFSQGKVDFRDIVAVVDLVPTWFPQSVPSKLPNLTTDFQNCVTIPMDEKLEIVIFGEAEARENPNYPFSWYLRFEVMEKGTTVPR